MEDRLAEFRQVGSGSGKPVQIKNVASRFLPEFSEKLKILQQSIQQVKTYNLQIIKLREEIVAATLNEQEKRISNNVNRNIEVNKSLCTKVKAELEALKIEVDLERKEKPNEPETRMKIQAYQAFSNKFSGILKEFQNVQVDYKNSVKSKLARQARILDENLTETQVQALVNDPDGLQRLYAKQHIGATHTKIQNTLSDIQDKYNDIKNLEQSVKAIHQMFMDMSLLIQAQGITIDSIELNLTEAQDYVKSAERRLVTAKKEHEKAKKLKCMVMIIIILAAAVGFYFIFR